MQFVHVIWTLAYIFNINFANDLIYSTVLYCIFIDLRNKNAIARKPDPVKSPKAVKYGIAQLSGSIFHFHIKWIIKCARYNRSITWKWKFSFIYNEWNKIEKCNRKWDRNFMKKRANKNTLHNLEEQRICRKQWQYSTKHRKQCYFSFIVITKKLRGMHVTV